MADNSNSRRDFLQAGAVGTAAIGLLAGEVLAADAVAKGLPMRPLGKTGEKVSLICLGGWHIGDVKDKKEAVKIMHAAIDEGLTFFDNAWDYHDGGSEEIMGEALCAGRQTQKSLPHDQELRPRCSRNPQTSRR